MAYIPPHKRHSKDQQVPSPTPELFVCQFNRNLKLGSHKHNADRSGKIVYADNAIYRWFAVELDEDGRSLSSLHLEPISLEIVEKRRGEKPLVLVNNSPAKDNDEVGEKISRCPWEIVAENVWPDILSTFNMVSNLMEEKPTLVARFGKVLFHGRKSLSLETARKSQVGETILRQLQRSFYTNVPETFVEKVTSGVVPNIGADFEEEKDIYHIKLSDSSRPQSSVSCKCSVRENKELELYKVELNPVRHVVVDISCLDKNVDLRLALYTKKILTDMTDDEMHMIKNLIDSAILDPEVKGGLRWPLGKATSGDRFRVIAVWHTKFRSHKNPSLRLKVRHADRFDFKTGTGETTVEIALKLKRVVSEIQEEKIDTDSTYDVFIDNLKLIWDDFLSCEQLST